MNLYNIISNIRRCYNLFVKATLFYQSLIYRRIYLIGFYINHYYIIIIVAFYILLSAVFNTSISFCEDFTDYPRLPYDDRTCYEIIHESLDWDKPYTEIIDEHGSWIEHLPNGISVSLVSY